MAWAAAAAIVASTVLSAKSQMDQGKAAAEAGAAQQAALNSQAAQMRQRAGQERAVAQRAAQEQRRKANLVQSRARAVTAASGTSLTDPTNIDILSDIAGEGEYRALSAMYQGEEQARGLEFGAGLKDFEGQQAYKAGQVRKKAANMAALTSVLNTAGSALYLKYGLPGTSNPSGLSGGNATPWVDPDQAYTNIYADTGPF